MSGAFRSAALLVLLCLQASAAQFQDVTAAAGLSNEGAYCFSAAWGDYDNDGYPDLYIAEGFTSAHVNSLYHNNRDGTFTRKTGTQAGPIASDAHDSFGCAWIDFSNSGYPDMLVINGAGSPSRPDLYLNNGDSTFHRGSAGSLTDQAIYTSWAACVDFDGDGLVDIFLTAANSTSGPFYPRLYHATPSGIFAPIDFGPASNNANDAVWGDYNNDGKPDLYVCNLDSPTSGLWRNDGQSHFTKMTNGLPSLPPSGGYIAHAAFGDYDNDGNLDIAISESDGTHIYQNDGHGSFIAVTNLGAVSYGSVAAWADYDNDGHLDLLGVNGQNTATLCHLYHNNGDGTFTSVSDPLTSSAHNYLAGAWGDYDNDGFMDAVLTDQYGSNRLFYNLGNTNHWIKFKLVGTASNRDAIGAKVRVLATIGGKTFWQMREVNGGYSVQNDLRPNFGLGDATNVDLVRIEWPSGVIQTFTNVAPGQIVTVVEHQIYSGPSPAFARATTTTNGIQLSLTEPAAGAVYALEASTDLVGWTKLTAHTSSGGTFNFTDPSSATYAQRFYRVRVP